jgi:iron complex outermembrane receptor protein/vitamin B12 transporter
MHARRLYRICFYLLLVLSPFIRSLPLLAIPQSALQGRVLDPQGALVSNAKVTLLQGTNTVSTARTSENGTFAFSALDTGWYYVRVEATGFTKKDTPSVFLARGKTANLEVLLQIGPLQQQIVVSATGTELPKSQVGASVSVIDREQLQALNKLDVFESLRLVPGVQVVETGQRGGTTSVFVGAGNANFNKVLIDGIPANDIGGDFKFAALSTGGVDRLEILRGPNSVLYGADALASVINITRRRGGSIIPEFTYSGDGGNFHSYRQQGSLAGAFRQFDYFSDFSRFDTQNSLPNNSFHNGTYARNFGWQASPTSGLRTTVRRTAAAVGLPNAMDFYGIPDDSFQKDQNTYVGVTGQHQTTARWHNLVRYAYARLDLNFVNPYPTGDAFDPFGFGPNFLGNTVTIRGANGFSATGRAILDFGGDYPQRFHASTTRQSVYAQSDLSIRPDLAASFGFRYENESGFTEFAGSKSPTDRNNFSYFLEAHGSLQRRVYAAAGVGFEDNAVFGFAASPRVSLAYYLRQPSSDRFLAETKLKFNFGKGIKEPSIFNEGSSLFRLLWKLPQGPGLIPRFGVSPIGPERSRSFDFGVEQGLAGGRARLGVTFFHNRFFDLIEFVRKSVLPQLGVPPEVAAATAFGAAINSSSFRARGAEAELEASLGHGLHWKGAYTYLDAVVTKSFSSSALEPAFNPAFPGIPIGAFSPLVGNPPFRRARHSGSLLVDYSRQRWGLALSGYLVGRQDDSTFLSDAFFGNSLLLPNRHLNGGYQKVDWSGWYTVNRVTTVYTSVENLLSQRYQAASGFPALPLTFRTRIRLTLGGEGWRQK